MAHALPLWSGPIKPIFSNTSLSLSPDTRRPFAQTVTPWGTLFTEPTQHPYLLALSLGSTTATHQLSSDLLQAFLGCASSTLDLPLLHRPTRTPIGTKMNPSPTDYVPTEHQRRCIQRMLQTKDKRSIVERLLAWMIHFAFQDALQHVYVTNNNNHDNNGDPSSGPDVLGPLRLYNTFNNDDLDCLASLAEVPLPTIERWIDESGKHF
jgi:hypothetical protein